MKLNRFEFKRSTRINICKKTIKSKSEVDNELTSELIVAGLMHLPREQLEPNDSINDDDEDNEQRNV